MLPRLLVYAGGLSLWGSLINPAGFRGFVPVIVLVRPLSLARARRPLVGCGCGGEQKLFAHFRFYSETREVPEQQEKQEACEQTDNGSHLSVARSVHPASCVSPVLQRP